MNTPNPALQTVLATLMGEYARQGRYPRPEQVTQEALDELQALCASISLTAARPKQAEPAPAAKYQDHTMKQIIMNLDSQMDMYERPALLVNYSLCRLSMQPIQRTGYGIERDSSARSPCRGGTQRDGPGIRRCIGRCLS